MGNHDAARPHAAGSSRRGQDHAHDHVHGIADPALAATDRGMWALKWSFVGLLATAALQAVVVVVSGSVALLADTIHNVADAATAVPLAIAFAFARRGPADDSPTGTGGSKNWQAC
jgi:Co/Zn/Cd efflux system component